MHRQVQKRIASRFAGIGHLPQGDLHVGQIAMVFRVLVNPEAGNGFNGLQSLTCLGLGMDGAEEAAHVRL